MDSSQDQAITLGDWAYGAIAKHYKKVLNHEQGVLTDSDPEELHQMRVGLRRLRTALIGFEAAIEVTSAMTQKEIGKSGRILGKLRDLDVMEAALAKIYLPQLPKSEQTVLQNLLKQLKKQRQSQFKIVKKFLQLKRYDSFKLQFQQWLDEPQYQAIAAVEIQQILPDLLLPQLSEFLLHPAWWVGIPQQKITPTELDSLLQKDGFFLHDLRKIAKRSRYNRELFLPLYGAEYQQHLQSIKEVQAILGELQDTAVLTDFFLEIIGRKWAKQLPTLAKIFRTNRTQIWQKWQSLQRHFLDTEYRLVLHETLCQPNF